MYKEKVILYCLFFAIIISNVVGCSSQETTTTRTNSPTSTHQKDMNKAADINMQLGIGYLQRGQNERAKEKLVLALKQNPASPQIMDAMAFYLQATGSTKEAESFYQKALRAAPKQGTLLNNYGVFLCGQHKYELALRYIEEATRDPAYATLGKAYENAGLCALQIPDVKRAKNYFTLALRNESMLVNANLEMAKICFKDKEYGEAQFHLKNYNAVAKPNPESLLLSIQLAQMKGDLNTVSSDALLLKNQFPLSKEYQQFKKLGIAL